MKTILAASAAVLSLLAFVPVANAGDIIADGGSVWFYDLENLDDDVTVSYPAPRTVVFLNEAGIRGVESADTTECVKDDALQATCVGVSPDPAVPAGNPLVNVELRAGNDRVQIDGQNPTRLRIFGGDGDDEINAVNGAENWIYCGAGNDTVYMDSLDKLNPLGNGTPGATTDCENVNPDGGGGGGGGGCVGNDCFPGGPGSPPAGPQDIYIPPTPYTVLVPKTAGLKLAKVLKKGLKVTAECSPTKQVKGTISIKRRGTVSKASGTCKPGGSLLFKFKKADQKRYKNKKSLTLKLVVKDTSGKTLTLLQVKLYKKPPANACSATAANAAC